MPTDKTAHTHKKQSKASKKDWNTTFVECRLSKEDAAVLDAMSIDYEQLFQWVDDMNSDGYKLALSIDKRSDCATGYLTHTDAQHENAGYTLSARGRTAAHVVLALRYKHEVKLDGVWGSEEVLKEDFSFWM